MSTIETRPAHGASSGRAATQRERLLNAVVDLSMHLAPQELTVAKISSRARVSSATFYELFDGREDVQLAALGLARDRLFAHVRLQSGACAWRASARGALHGLLEAMRIDPAAGWMLCVQARGGGPRLRAELDRCLEQLERGIEARLLATADEATLDLPATALVGALEGLIFRYLRTRREDRLPLLLDDALAWIGSYEIGADERRWCAGPGPRRERAVLAAGSTASKAPWPAKLPRGNHGLPAGFIARSQRTRLILATAQVTLEKGYADATVAEIVAHAAVARDVFYQYFSSKQDAFAQTQGYAVQHVLERCVAAYFQARDWPEGVWRVLELVLSLIAEHPALAHLQLLGCYQAGPRAARRIEATGRSFGMFLQEGYGDGLPAACSPPLCAEATVAAILAIIQRHLARGEAAALPRALPLLAYLALAPVMGPVQAVRLVEQLAITSR